jgi:tRNA(Ile)-lysidine synthase
VQINLPCGAAVSIFAEAIGQLAGSNKPHLLLAVSGGPDSLAMLLLAKAAMPDHIHAATIDHGLRAEAADEAQFVAEICAILNVPHSILAPDHPITGNIQSNARAARYSLLQKHAVAADCQWIATAHHADDQLETLLMRIMRGSGVDGLAAIRMRNGNIIRPCLNFTKTELMEICTNAGVSPIHDPSNDNVDFDRVALRQWLAANDAPFDSKRALRTTSAISDASEALNWTVEHLQPSHLQLESATATLTPADLPREILRRLLLRALTHIQPDIAPRADSIDHALTLLSTGRVLTIGNILCSGGEKWTFRPAPSRKH